MSGCRHEMIYRRGAVDDGWKIQVPWHCSPPPKRLNHVPFSKLSPTLLLFMLACEPAVVGYEEDTQEVNSSDSAQPTDDTGCTLMTFWLDNDGDGYGSTTTEACEAEPGMVELGDDCDDTDSSVYPNAPELCDDQDNDCDGSGDPPTCDGPKEPGEYSLEDADAKLWSSNSGYDAGRRFDVGDVDGDGTNDVVVSAMWANGYKGGAYVVSGPLLEDEPLPEAGYWLSGDSTSYEGARSIGVTEATGDGYADIMMGAPDAPGYDVVVMFGPVTEDTTFSDADLRFICTAAIECGHGSDMADFNGDGVGDAIIGAGEETTGGFASGSVYLIYGPLTGGEYTLQDVVDAELVGTASGIETGRKVSADGDFNGDGIDDLIATAGYDSTAAPYAGAILVVYGPVTGTMSMNDSDGTLLGETSYDYAGEATAMGDVDGDGLADAIIGSYAHANYDGATYVVHGPASGTMSLGDAGAIVRGEDEEQVGFSMSGSDTNGDGVGDLLVGAPGDDREARDAGAAYLFLGPVEGTYSLNDASYSFLGESRDDTAGSGVKLGDINNDGLSEVLVGAPTDNTGGSAAGAMYVFDLGF